jgi:hypothetical protein
MKWKDFQEANYCLPMRPKERLRAQSHEIMQQSKAVVLKTDDRLRPPIKSSEVQLH